ncbi:MAG: lysylphosphatidylglycerol synthase domain-containing protein [Polyangiales bacterium]
MSGKRPNAKSIVLLLLKVLISFGGLYLIYRTVLNREGIDDLWSRLATVKPGWVAAAILMQLIAVAFSAVRWQRLLIGQGIHAPWSFLGGSIMIARFWGAFTPGGFTGFGGWRIYDVATHTGKTERAAATIGVEMVLGQLAFGVVVMIGSLFGMRFIGMHGVIVVNAFFLVIIAVGLLFLARPRIFLGLTRWLPAWVQQRIQTLIDAVLAYQGKGGLLLQAALLGVGTHAFNNMIYVCAARALDVKLGVGEVFFASSLQILATIVPASINGIGLREAAAVALYTSPLIGLPMSVAVLIPTLGFACEMLVSAVGGLIFLSRRTGYKPHIVVDDADREQKAYAAIDHVPKQQWPSRSRAVGLGVLSGAIAGVAIGLLEAMAISVGGEGTGSMRVFVYGATAYAALGAVLGAGLGFVSAQSGRWMQRAAVPAPKAVFTFAASVFFPLAFALSVFRVRRDVFHEELVLKSGKGLVVVLGCAVGSLLLAFVVGAVLRALLQIKPFQRLQQPAVAITTTLFAIVVGVFAIAVTIPRTTDSAASKAAVPYNAQQSVLFIVIDTLRADHLPAYGYGSGHTPNLDELTKDAIAFLSKRFPI